MFQNKRKDRIGQMDEKISIYRETTVRDVMGATTIQKVPVVTNWWAKVEYESMQEDAEEDKIQFLQTIKVTMRYVQCNERYIISHDGKFYDIYSVEPVNRKSYVILKANLIHEPDNA